MAPIGHVNGGPLNARVAPKPCADKLAVPRPVIEGVGGGMHADPATPSLHPALQRGLLGRVKGLPGSR